MTISDTRQWRYLKCFALWTILKTQVQTNFKYGSFFFFISEYSYSRGKSHFFAYMSCKYLCLFVKSGLSLRLARTQSRNAKTLYLFSKSCSFHDLEDLDVEGFLNNIYQFSKRFWKLVNRIHCFHGFSRILVNRN